MEILVKLGIDDWMKFQLHLEQELRKSTKSCTSNFFVNVIVWTVITLVLLMFFRDLVDSFHWPTAIAVAVLCFLILLMLILDAGKLRKAFAPNENGAFVGEHQFTFDEQGITARGEGYETSVDWSTVMKIERVNGMILLYMDTAYAYLIPENQLQEPDALYSYICEKHSGLEADRQKQK